MAGMGSWSRLAVPSQAALSLTLPFARAPPHMKLNPWSFLYQGCLDTNHLCPVLFLRDLSSLPDGLPCELLLIHPGGPEGEPPPSLNLLCHWRSHLAP